MNEIRVKEVIKDRYNTYFRGLVNKITSQRRSGIAILYRISPSNGHTTLKQS